MIATDSEGAMGEAVPGWTNERVERLRRLWDEGLSASRIAAEIGGVSRNAVIGKIHRMGLAGRARGSAAGRAEEAVVVPAEEATLPESPAILAHRPAPDFPMSEFPALAPRPAAEPVALAATQRVTIMDLRESMCRWPMGDPTSPDFRFCGGRAITGLPYCTQHAQIAYQPAAERKRDRRVSGFR